MTEINRLDSSFLRAQEILMDEIKHYEFINKEGRLDLDFFAVFLGNLFVYDGLSKKEAPPPEAITSLLLDILESKGSKEELKLWIQSQKLIDWTPEYAHIYPDKKRTLIHVAGLITRNVLELWIYNIGRTLLKLPENAENKLYYSWIKPEWILVKAFIEKLHNDHLNLMKKTDKDGFSERGYSYLESFNHANNNDISYEDAAKELKSIHDSYTLAQKRSQSAIDSHFYLEAIALQESVISNLLNRYLRSKNIKLNNVGLKGLISRVEKQLVKEFKDIELLKGVDYWRKQRNSVIHGFVEKTSSDIEKSLNEFIDESSTAAMLGQELISKVIEWYIDESMDFIDMQFKSNQNQLQ